MPKTIFIIDLQSQFFGRSPYFTEQNVRGKIMAVNKQTAPYSNLKFKQVTGIEGFCSVWAAKKVLWWCFLEVQLMSKELLLTELRILLLDSVPPRTPTLKLCLNNLLFHYKQIVWNPTCQRFEGTSPLPLPTEPAETLQLELYYNDGSKLPVVVGEGRVECRLLQLVPVREIKIPLTYDGLLVGWVYCEPRPDYDQNAQDIDPRHLFIHKVAVLMLKEEPHDMELTIFKNQDKLYTKSIYFNTQKKTVFTNLKQEVKVSDLIRFTFGIKQSPYQSIREVSFLVDNVKRGKTVNYDSWLRNGMKNKVGQIKVEYFMENVFLQNEKVNFGRRKVLKSGSIGQFSSLIAPIPQEKSIGMSTATNTVHNSLEKLDQTLKKRQSLEKKPAKTTAFRVTGTENKVPREDKKVSITPSRMILPHSNEEVSKNQKNCFVRKKKTKIDRSNRIRQDGLDKTSFYFGDKQ